MCMRKGGKMLFNDCDIVQSHRVRDLRDGDHDHYGQNEFLIIFHL